MYGALKRCVAAGGLAAILLAVGCAEGGAGSPRDTSTQVSDTSSDTTRPTDSSTDEDGVGAQDAGDEEADADASGQDADTRVGDTGADGEETDGMGPRVACNYEKKAKGVCVNSYVESNGECHQPEDYEDEETLCDDKDNDCDGAEDENCPCAYLGKSAGVCGNSTVDPATGKCAKPDEYESDETSCDKKDNDCDTEVDEAGDPKTFYRDADGDGYGDPSETTLACSEPSGYADNASDCNDSSASIRPGAPEECGDGVDSDCGGEQDENDPDADDWCHRFSSQAECGDENANNTASEHICCYFESTFNNRRFCYN